MSRTKKESTKKMSPEVVKQKAEEIRQAKEKNQTETPSAEKVADAIKETKIKKVKEPKVKKEKYDPKLVGAVKLWALKNSNRLKELMTLLKSYHSIPLNSITGNDLELQTALYGDLDKVEQTIKKHL